MDDDTKKQPDDAELAAVAADISAELASYSSLSELRKLKVCDRIVRRVREVYPDKEG